MLCLDLATFVQKTHKIIKLVSSVFRIRVANIPCWLDTRSGGPMLYVIPLLSRRLYKSSHSGSNLSEKVMEQHINLGLNLYSFSST